MGIEHPEPTEIQHPEASDTESSFEVEVREERGITPFVTEETIHILNLPGLTRVETSTMTISEPSSPIVQPPEPSEPEPVV